MRHVLAILAGLSWAASPLSAMASVLEHLGAPPPGQAWVELEASGSITPVQLAGTVCPPTLVINGQPLKLAEAAAALPEGGGKKDLQPALWVSGVKRESSGKSGRFFIQLSLEESAVESVEVLLRCPAANDSRTFRGRVPLGRIFLDGPIHAHRTIPARAPGDKSLIELSLAGTIPAGATLTLEDGGRFGAGDAVIPIHVPVGQALIAGKLAQPDGTTRNLSIPVTVKIRDYDPLKPVLSVEPPAAWTFEQSGARLKGITNPGASLSIDGKPVEVGRDGSFETRLLPPAAEWKIQFRVQLADGTPASFSHAANSPDFKVAQGDCPAGTHPAGAAPPAGFAISCERPDGTKHGPFAEWHPNGRKKTEGAYLDGLPDGPWQSWHESGREKEQGRYLHGEKICEWLQWDETTGARTAVLAKGVPECEAANDPSLPFSLGRFRLSAVELLQGAGGSSTTWNAQWTPRLRLPLLPRLSAQGYLGVSLPNKQGGGIATLLEYGGKISWDRLPGLHGLGLEIGGGAQTWISYGGTFPQGVLLLTWNLPKAVLHAWLTHLFIGDAVAFLPGDMAHQLHLGAGFRFF